MLKKLSHLCIAFFFSVSSFAQVVPPRNSPFANNKGSNYYVGLDKGRPLIQVSILSGVNNPGVYHIPIGTNISELISYAGGATSNSDLGDVSVRSRTNDKQFTSTNLDVKDLLTEKGSLPALQDQDVVYIPQEEGLDRTIKWLTLASLAASIASAIVVISDRD